jgi:hypothetical protein
MAVSLERTQHSFNMASYSNSNSNSNSNSKMTPLFDWGINLSYEEHVNRHVPSGEHNSLVASIIHAERRGERFIKNHSDTPYDLSLSMAQNAVKEKEEEEKRLLASIQKVKDGLSEFIANSSESEPDEDEDEEEEESGDLPETDLRGHREKSGKAPKWVQGLESKKQKAEALRKRKSLLSSLKTQSDSLAEVRKQLAEQRIHLSKQEELQKTAQLLHKALLGAERSYRESHDVEFLVKNVHHNMALWDKKTKSLLPPPKMVQRLVGSPGSFKTVMVPEHERQVVPLSEFLREDW